MAQYRKAAKETTVSNSTSQVTHINLWSCLNRDWKTEKGDTEG
jgi:hypothetical protein